MVDYADEDNENGRLLTFVKLFDLLIEGDYLVNRSVDQAKTVLDHIHEDGIATFTWGLEFDKFWVVIHQIQQVTTIQDGLKSLELFLVLLTDIVAISSF